MPARILVIEDNPSCRELLMLLLAACEHLPFAAPDGEEGVALALRERPDLVICDIELPGMNGFEVLRRLRADPATRAIPVLALTAFSMLGSRERALAAGFDGFLGKPVTSKTLVCAIEAVMAGQGQEAV